MQIIKRNGFQVAEFDPDKIYQAIIKAAQTVYVLDDTWRQNLAQVTKKVVLDLFKMFRVERPTINMIQSLVENRLMEAGFINIAEHYISYRLQRDLERNGYGDKAQLSTYALSRLNKKSHQAMAFFVSNCHFVFFKSFIKDSSSCPWPTCR